MPGPFAARYCRLAAWAGVAALAVLTRARAGSAEEPEAAAAGLWKPGQPVPIAVAGGRTEFDVPTPQAGSKTLVIVSALARGAGLFPMRLTALPARRVGPAPLADDGPRRLAERVAPGALAAAAPLGAPRLPPGERTFHLMVHDGDVASASNYSAVDGKLRAVGRRVQVYVDIRDNATVREDLLRDLVATFDDHVYPTAARWLGVARDVDDDGRFTVLITGWLARLAGGRLAVDGFVRGADLDPDLASPFGNRCDMMYLSASIAPGPHLRTVLAHEYTHAVTASLKAFGGPDGGRWGLEEEGWLDEAIAHLAEDLHGFSRSNLDYRISAFLSSPERYRLVVDDYYAADLFRSHGNRGSTYLFLRFCVDQLGPDLLGTLARSSHRGVANLEAATGTPFAALYRRWTVALGLSGMIPARGAAAAEYRALDLRGEVNGWTLAGPRFSTVRPGGLPDAWSATGTSSHFALVEASPTGSVHVIVTGPAESDMQVTAVPLPADMARLELAVEAESRGDGRLVARIRARERDGSPVRLESLAWEPLVPAAETRQAGAAPHHGDIDERGIAAACGTASLPARGELRSPPITLSGVDDRDVPLIVKAVGIDARGRRMAAWAEVTPASLAAGKLEVDAQTSR